jgi:predicted nuclease of predicted toxin-antitoxin system
MDTLRFLADESCDFTVVRALREAGYDVLAVSDFAQRSDDRQVLAQASREKRILLTEDKDFGWLVFVSQAASVGVMLIRFPGYARKLLGPAIVRLVQEQGEQLRGAFVVVQPDHVRIGRGVRPPRTS